METEYKFHSTLGDGTVDELTTTDSFLKYVKDYHPQYHFTDKETELLLGYYEGHDYMLGAKDGVLYRGDLAENRDEIWWTDYTMDDVIDMACEWNYELILELDAERQNPDDFIDFVKKQEHYDQLKSDEVVLDRLFEQTKYHVQVNETAKILADAFVQSIKHVPVETAVTGLVTEIKNQSVGGRSR